MRMWSLFPPLDFEAKLTQAEEVLVGFFVEFEPEGADCVVEQLEEQTAGFILEKPLLDHFLVVITDIADFFIVVKIGVLCHVAVIVVAGHGAEAFQAKIQDFSLIFWL